MRTIVIAEAGVNHNGDIDRAREMIDVAVEAGADYVKFQTFNSTNLVTRSAEQAEYQSRNLGAKTSQYEMLRKLELSHDAHQELCDYCVDREIGFFSTAFDFESVDFLHKLGLKLWKIPSGEITNLPYLEKIASFADPIILSTGMATLGEIGETLKVFRKLNFPTGKLTVLHCTSEYPAKLKDVNLRAMKTIADTYNVKIGYSDHTLGIEVPLAAVALGATVIEKHFTLDRSLPGPDHKASLTPDELKQMVNGIRVVEEALGRPEKAPSEIELQNKLVVRKSIVARRAIRKGEVFTEENITTKRPGTGISPMMWHEVLGQQAQRDFGEDELIS